MTNSALERNMKIPHRTNPDGTIDAICPRCFATIGTSMWESDLERLEAAHTCDVKRLRYIDQLRGDHRKSNQPGPLMRLRSRFMKEAGK
jgi:hypothetical protein